MRATNHRLSLSIDVDVTPEEFKTYLKLDKATNPTQPVEVTTNWKFSVNLNQLNWVERQAKNNKKIKAETLTSGLILIKKLYNELPIGLISGQDNITYFI